MLILDVSVPPLLCRCIFVELLTGQSPFPGKDERNQLELILKICGTPTEENWPGVSKLEGYKYVRSLNYRNRLAELFGGKFDPRALDLLTKLLSLDPLNRPTASEALDHEYFWSDPMPCKPEQYVFFCCCPFFLYIRLNFLQMFNPISLSFL